MIKYTEPKYDIDYQKLRDLSVKNFAAIQNVTDTSSKESRISEREKVIVTFIGTGLGRYSAILGKRATAGVLISYYPKNKPPYDMLMDPGCRVQERLRELGYNLADTDVVLFTHAHYDHFQQKDQILEGATGAALKRGKITIISNATCLDGSPEEIPEITKYQQTFGTVIKLDPYESVTNWEKATVGPYWIEVEAHKSMHGEVKGTRKVNSYIFKIPTESGKLTYGNISEGPAFKDEKGEWIKEGDQFKLNKSLFDPFTPCDLLSAEIGPFTCTGHKLWENHCGYEGAEAILTYLLKNNSPVDIFVEKEWGHEMTNIFDQETRNHFKKLPLKTFSEASAYKAYDTARNLGRKDVMVIDAVDKTQIVYYPDTREYRIRVPILITDPILSIISMFGRKIFPNPDLELHDFKGFDNELSSLPIVKEGNTEFIEIDWKK